MDGIDGAEDVPWGNVWDSVSVDGVSHHRWQ